MWKQPVVLRRRLMELHSWWKRPVVGVPRMRLSLLQGLHRRPFDDGSGLEPPLLSEHTFEVVRGEEGVWEHPGRREWNFEVVVRRTLKGLRILWTQPAVGVRRRLKELHTLWTLQGLHKRVMGLLQKPFQDTTLEQSPSY